jgi:hypothetical protein
MVWVACISLVVNVVLVIAVLAMLFPALLKRKQTMNLIDVTKQFPTDEECLGYIEKNALARWRRSLPYLWRG